MEERLIDYRNAAKVHKNIRQKLNNFIKPGIKLIDICNLIESNIKNELPNELNNGIAFPVGVSLNNIAAHWTPINNNDNTIFKKDDVLKIDYGTHINGNIIDSAFTIGDSKYSKLLEASKESVYNVIKNIGVDTKINELEIIADEIVNSYEIELNNKIIPLKKINNIYGHSIEQWKIHGKKYIGNKLNKDIIEENDILAIEIYVSTGSGTTIMEDIPSHFMLKNIEEKTNNNFLEYLKKTFKTLPFCQRYIDEKYKLNLDYYLNQLFINNNLNIYPPLVEPIQNSFISQFEHTIHVSENGIENLSIDSDY